MVSPHSKSGPDQPRLSQEGGRPEEPAPAGVAGPTIYEKAQLAREQKSSDEKDKISVEEQLPVQSVQVVMTPRDGSPNPHQAGETDPKNAETLGNRQSRKSSRG